MQAIQARADASAESESLRDDLDITRRELKGDIKSISDAVKSEVEIRRKDVISLHQKIDANKKRK